MNQQDATLLPLNFEHFSIDSWSSVYYLLDDASTIYQARHKVLSSTSISLSSPNFVKIEYSKKLVRLLIYCFNLHVKIILRSLSYSLPVSPFPSIQFLSSKIYFAITAPWKLFEFLILRTEINKQVYVYDSTQDAFVSVEVKQISTWLSLARRQDSFRQTKSWLGSGCPSPP